MMKIITMISEFFLLQTSFKKLKAVLISLENSVKRAKFYALFLLGAIVSSLFVFAGLVVGIIELGLQWEKRQGFYFSGLMLSMSVFFGIAIFIDAICLWLLRSNGAKIHHAPPGSNSDSGIPPEIQQAVEQITHQVLNTVTQKIAETVQQFASTPAGEPGTPKPQHRPPSGSEDSTT